MTEKSALLITTGQTVKVISRLRGKEGRMKYSSYLSSTRHLQLVSGQHHDQTALTSGKPGNRCTEAGGHRGRSGQNIAISRPQMGQIPISSSPQPVAIPAARFDWCILGKGPNISNSKSRTCRNEKLSFHTQTSRSVRNCSNKTTARLTLKHPHCVLMIICLMFIRNLIQADPRIHWQYVPRPTAVT